MSVIIYLVSGVILITIMNKILKELTPKFENERKDEITKMILFLMQVFTFPIWIASFIFVIIIQFFTEE